MELTREEAIREHRKMWNWIADQYAKHIDKTVDTLKRQYLQKTEYALIQDECFCCEYAYNTTEDINKRKDRCVHCPLKWEAEDDPMYDGFYCERLEADNDGDRIFWSDLQNLCYDTSDCEDKKFRERERIARKIANLPEK